MPNKFTAEEIFTANEVRKQIIEDNIEELKSIYMAGEINMWVEMSEVVTKERERVKPLVEALEWYADRDNYLTDFYNCDLPEDSALATAWSKGNIEVKAKTALANYNKSLKQTP